MGNAPPGLELNRLPHGQTARGFKDAQRLELNAWQPSTFSRLSSGSSFVLSLARWQTIALHLPYWSVNCRYELEETFGIDSHYLKVEGALALAFGATGSERATRWVTCAMSGFAGAYGPGTICPVINFQMMEHIILEEVAKSELARVCETAASARGAVLCGDLVADAHYTAY